MNMNLKFFAAFAAVAVLSAPAFAQQSARRNNEDSRRQTQKVERQQTRVDKNQKPTNITNQPVTDQKVRQAQSSNPYGNGNRPPTGGVGNRPPTGGVGNQPPTGNRPNTGGNQPPTGGVGNQPPTGNRPNTGGSQPPSGGNQPSGGYGNQPPVGNQPPSGNRPPTGNYPPSEGYGNRPPMPPAIDYSRSQIFERTNASNIVVYTTFRTKEEAYDYIDRLLFVKSYTVNSYGNNYNWLQTDVAFIPTPFDWTNPMTHNQFRMKFYITRSFGEIRVSITADWRESYLSNGFSSLRFQPSDRYSTYYAWNVLEDMAASIPHTRVAYR